MSVEQASNTDAVRRNDLPFWWDFHLILLGGVVLLVLIAGGETVWFLEPMRVVIGLIYVLLVPGYCVVSAIFPDPRDLDGSTRIAVSTGLSIAFVPPVAVILDRLPAGIHIESAIVSLFLTILVCLAITWYRRRRLTAVVPEVIQDIVAQSGWCARHRAVPVLVAVLALVLVSTASSVAVRFLAQHSAERLTEFYLVGPDGLAEGFPRTATAGQPVAIMIGIINREGAPADYRVEVRQDEQVIGQTKPRRLEDGATDERFVTFVPTTVGDDVKITLLLYRDGDREPYRTLWLWMAVQE